VTPLDDVGHLAGRLDAAAEVLGDEPASVLLPDIGGVLLWGHLRVYDLPGLCDPTIARTYLKDTPAFNDYVLREARPTFIRLHTYWKRVTSLEEDERFSRDYVPVWERADGEETFWVRRQALGGRNELLAELGAVLAR
jgi:hypothetical protein